jgi:hypothetical protein
MVFKLSYFERLVETATLIARHPEYPTKFEVIERCRHEVGELNDGGRINNDEAEILWRILESRPALAAPEDSLAGVGCGAGRPRLVVVDY